MRVRLKKVLAVTLAAAMAFSIFSSNLGSYADETDTEITAEAETEAKTEETTEAPEATEEKTVESTEAETEAVTEAVSEETTEVVTEATTEVSTEATEVSSEEATTEISSEDVTEATTEEITEATTESSSEDKKEADKDEDKKKKDKKEKEKEEKIKPTFDHLYDGVSVAGLDFSSCELLIATSDASIFTADTDVVSEYNGIYLTRYKNAEQTKSAYTYYYKKVSFIDVNSTVRANRIMRESKTPSFKKKASETDADDDDSDSDSKKESKKEIPNDGHGEADMSDINEGDDALSNLNDTSIGNYSGCIALIDTGASGSNVIGSVSVLGGGAGDDNGHGTELAQAIAQANPNAKILSIKALNSGAIGTVSDVYAAIEYAIRAHVSIINLSMSSVCTQDSDSLRKAISEAQASGIRVVASAGNNGSNASYYVPAGIGGVITVGACDANGNRISSSNYGSSVEYYVVADSTSEAAAKLAGYLLSTSDPSTLDDVYTREEVEDKKEDSTVTPSPEPTATATPQKEEATDTDAEENEEEKETNKHYTNLDDQLEDILMANKHAKKGTTQFPLNITISITLHCDTLIYNPDGTVKGGYANYITVKGSSLKGVDSGYKMSDYKNFKCLGSYCCTPHAAIPLMSDETKTITGTATLDDGSIVVEEKNGVKTYTATYSTSSLVGTITQSQGGQAIGATFQMQYAVENSKIYIHKEDNNGYDLENIWFQLFSDAAHTKSLGFYKTSDAGNATNLRDINGDEINGGSIKLPPGSTVYLLEMGKKSGTTFKLPKNFDDTFVDDEYADTNGRKVIGNNSYTLEKGYIREWVLETKEVDKASSAKYKLKNITTPYYVGFAKKDQSTGNIIENLNGASFDIYYSKYSTWDDTMSHSDYGGIYKSISSYSFTNGKWFSSDWETVQIGSTYYTLSDLYRHTAYKYFYAVETAYPDGYTLPDSYSSYGYVWIPLTVRMGDVDDSLIDTLPFDTMLEKPKSYYVAAKKISLKTGEGVNGVHFTVYDMSNIDASGTPATIATDVVSKSYTYKNKSGNTVTEKGLVLVPVGEREYDSYHSFQFVENANNATDPNPEIQELWKYTDSDGLHPNQYASITATITANEEYDNEDGALSNAVYFKIKNWSTVPITFEKTIKNATKYAGNPNYSMNGIIIKLYEKFGDESSYIGEMVLDENGKVKQVKGDKSKLYQDDTSLDMSTHLYVASDKYSGTYVYYKEIIPAERQYAFEEFDYNNTCRVYVDPALTLNKFSIQNTPKEHPANIVIEKTTGNELLGGQSLENAWFTLKFYAQDITKPFAGGTPTKTWTFKTVKNGNKYQINLKNTINNIKTNYLVSDSELQSYITENGTNLKNSSFDQADTEDFNLPFGYITIEETKAPKGFNKDGVFTATDDKGQVTNADTNGVILMTTMGNNANVSQNYMPDEITMRMIETENRADIDIIKVGEDDKPMPNVPFLLSALDDAGNVVDSVTVYTDDDGYFSTATSYVAHTEKTNTEKAKVGTWFPTTGTPDDTVGALYVGKYSLRELRSSANRGRQLEREIKFEITDADAGTVKRVLDFDALDAHSKTWNMTNPTVKTKILCVETNSQMLGQDGVKGYNAKNQTAIDTVTYTNLREASDYTLKTELMVVTLDKNGKATNVTPYMEGSNPYVRVTPFHIDGTTHQKSYVEKSGTVDVTLTGIDPTGLEKDRKVLVAYETLYYGKYTTVDALNNAISNGTMLDTYPEFKDEDEMDIFPVDHKDPLDKDQTLTPVDVHTTATDNVTNDHIALPTAQTTITDRVFYSGLTVGEKYTVTGVLHVKADSAWSYKDGKFTSGLPAAEHVLTDANGNPVTATKEFTAESKDGYVDLEFIIDSTKLEGRSVVAFETLEYKGVELAIHADIEENQTVHFAQFKTTTWRMGAPKNDDGTLKYDDELTREVPASKTNTEFVDTIHYHNLYANSTYMIFGKLMDKVTGEVLKDATGKEITATGYFKTKAVAEVKDTDSPNANDFTSAEGVKMDMSADHADYLVDGEADLVFEGYDFSNLENVTGVVFEELYLVDSEKSEDKTKLVGEHKDITDVDEFLYIVSIHTNAKDTTTGIKVVPQDVETVIEDECSYSGLIPGKKYKLTATIHVKNDHSGKYQDGDTLKTSDGKDVTVDFEFIPDKSEGTQIVKIPINTTNLRYMELVVFEDLYNEYGILCASHSDLNDDKQTLEVPSGKTKAYGKDTGKNIAGANDTVTIVDTMFYENLEPNKTYKLHGQLMDKETNTPIIVNGKPVENTIEFTPTTKSGTVDIEFTFNASALKGKTVVCFEDILYLDKPLVIHHFIDDQEESIEFPSGHTTAFGKDTEDHILQVGKSVTLIDTVYYEGLIPGLEYEMEGTVYSKKTESPIKSGDNTITSTVKFTPESSSGSVDVEFTFSTEALQGATIVVFEDCYYTNPDIGVRANIFSHHDINDKDQSLSIPKLGTKATVDGKKNVVVDGEIAINDACEYKNLIPGKKYTIEGKLMNRDTGKKVLVNGKPVTAKKTFTPDSPNGTVNIIFEFDATGIGGDIVVFETLFYSDVEIADESDIENKSQTVTLTNPKVKLTPPKTGMMIFFVILGIIAVGGAGMLIFRKRRYNA